MSVTVGGAVTLPHLFLNVAVWVPANKTWFGPPATIPLSSIDNTEFTVVALAGRRYLGERCDRRFRLTLLGHDMEVSRERNIQAALRTSDGMAPQVAVFRRVPVGGTSGYDVPGTKLAFGAFFSALHHTVPGST